MTQSKTQVRPLTTIAAEITQKWPKPYFGAKPYIDAMATMTSVDDNYGWDTGRSVVLYFLANAKSWRGEDAKRIKSELKSML